MSAPLNPEQQVSAEDAENLEAAERAQKEIDRLRARVEELTQQRDDLLVEDALAEQQRDETVPRTERSCWVAIADALNAAHTAGMPVGIDLDGTLTDRETWSVIWDREAERWTVAGYDDEPTPAADTCGSQCPQHLQHTCAADADHPAGACRNAKDTDAATCTWDPADPQGGDA